MGIEALELMGRLAAGGVFAGEQALEATTIIAAGDVDAAQLFLDRVEMETPVGELLRKIGRKPTAEVAARHPLLVLPKLIERSAAETKILKRALSFADLTLALAVQLRAKDSEAVVILLEGAGVLSRTVARTLRIELCGAEAVKANVFVNQLARIFLDPRVENFADLARRPPRSEDVLLQRFAEEKEWVITDQFGRLTFLTAEESLKLRLEQNDGILHPSIKIASRDALPMVAVDVSPEILPVQSSADTIVDGAGALMRVASAAVKSKTETIPYTLLRRTIFRLLSEARFESAAAMVENISEPLVLARLFEDLVSAKTGDQNGFKNPKKFLANTATYAGMMFAEMAPAKVAQIILLLYRHSRLHDQQALDQWLLIAFRAIRPRERLADFGPKTKLPHLSNILGTLMEWEETRVLAERLLRKGLDPDHPAYAVVYEAVHRLHQRYPAFAHPSDIQTGAGTRIFDGEIAAREMGVVRGAGFLARISNPFGSRSLIAPHFDPPATVMARREEIYDRLKVALEKLDELENINPLLSSIACFSLPPSDVWRLVREVSEEKLSSPSQMLAQILSQQPADVVMAFFRAWGEGAKTLAALWNLGERGRSLVASIVELALKEEEATMVIQRLLTAEHAGDNDLMEAQMDIYIELAADPRFEGTINPYETFVTTGVLRPRDLSGKFREEAIQHALKILMDADQRDWHQQATNTLVQLKADEPAVVKYFAAQLGSEANEAFAVLDQLGPRADKALAGHIKKHSEYVVTSRTPGLGAIDNWLPLERSSVAIPLKDLLQKFPLTSRAMQKYVLDRITKKESVSQLAEMGDAALILLSPEVIQRWGDLNTISFRGGRDFSWETTTSSPIFAPLVSLAEKIGTPKAHAALVDLWNFAKDHGATKEQIDIIVGALERMRIPATGLLRLIRTD